MQFQVRITSRLTRPKFLFLITLLISGVTSQLQAVPSVTNVVATQESNGSGNTRLRVSYDLNSPVGAATVNLQYSTDGGASFSGTAATVTGDAGPGILTGAGRIINWAVGTDLPNQTIGNLVVRVLAEDAASSIPIANQGFETNAQPNATLTLSTPTGWTVYNPAIINGSSNTVGTLNPNGSTHYTSVPQGSNVGLVFLSGPNGEAGLEQSVGSTLQLNSLYTLQVEIGNITSGTANFGFFNLDGFPGYRVELRAGGVVVASDNNTLFGVIPEGGWRTSTIQASIGTAHPQAGAALSVRLVNLDIAGTPSAPALEVNFDDVRLRVAGTRQSAPLLVETVAPMISGIVAISAQELEVTYSEAMAGAGVAVASNYVVSGSGAGSLAANPAGISGGPSTYELTWPTGSQANGQPLTLTVSGLVQDSRGNPLPINGTANTASASGLPVTMTRFTVE